MSGLNLFEEFGAVKNMAKTKEVYVSNLTKCVFLRVMLDLSFFECLT